MCCSAVRFIAVLFALVASVCQHGGEERQREGLRRRQKKVSWEQKKKKKRFGGYLVNEGEQYEHLIPKNKNAKSNLWCLFHWSDVPMISSQKRQNQ